MFMNFIDIDFLKYPTYAWIFYLIAAFFIFVWIFLNIVRRKIAAKASGHGVAINGDSMGVVITGTVKGNITLERRARPSKSNLVMARVLSTGDRTLSLAANLSGIIGLLLAALTFYFTYS